MIPGAGASECSQLQVRRRLETGVPLAVTPEPGSSLSVTQPAEPLAGVIDQKPTRRLLAPSLLIRIPLSSLWHRLLVGRWQGALPGPARSPLLRLGPFRAGSVGQLGGHCEASAAARQGLPAVAKLGGSRWPEQLQPCPGQV